VLAGVEEFTLPVYTRMRVITVSSVFGSIGGVLEHPAGANVEIPPASFEGSVRVRIEEVPSPTSELPLASGSFEIQVVPEATPAPSVVGPQLGRSLAAASTSQGIFRITLNLTQTVQDVTDVAVEAAVSGTTNLYYAAQTTLVRANNAVQATLRQVGAQVVARYEAVYTQTVSCEDEYKLLKAPQPEDPDGDAEGRPVVYVHGIQVQRAVCLLWRGFDPSTEGGEVFKHLNETGLGQKLQYWRYTYPTFKSIDEAASKLASALQTQFPGRKDVIIIAHSMGGLVARAAILRHGASAQVSHLITLGTPHGGVPLADPLFYLNAFVASQAISEVSLFDPDAVGQFEIRVAVDLLAKGFVPSLILLQPGAQDLQPEKVQALLGEGASTEPLDRYFTFAGTLDQPDLNPYRCGDGFFLCQFVALGFIANEVQGLGPSDGFVLPQSALLDGSQKQTALGSGYDHFELHKGDFNGTFRDPDPLLTRVASIIADLSTPHALFAASGQGSGAPPSDLYLVDASATGRDLLVGRVRTGDGFAPVITDLAVSPEGNLWGVSFDRLYQIDKATGTATEVGTLGVFGANALGFDANGALFGATTDGSFIKIDTRTGTASVLGSLGSGFVSWGDIAFAPDGRLFGTVRTIGGTGLLVLIDPTNGRATPVSPATGIGFDNVWGLTFVGNDLFGLTTSLAPGSGQLIKIDVSAGTGMFVRNLSFNAFGAGAASRDVGAF